MMEMLKGGFRGESIGYAFAPKIIQNTVLSLLRPLRILRAIYPQNLKKTEEKKGEIWKKEEDWQIPESLLPNLNSKYAL